MKNIMGKIIIATLVAAIIGLLAYAWSNGDHGATYFTVGSILVITGINLFVDAMLPKENED